MNMYYLRRFHFLYVLAHKKVENLKTKCVLRLHFYFYTYFKVAAIGLFFYKDMLINSDYNLTALFKAKNSCEKVVNPFNSI